MNNIDLETLKTKDLIFLDRKLFLDVLVEKYGGRRTSHKSAIINFIYESKYVEGWTDLNLGVHEITLDLPLDDFAIIRNGVTDVQLVEKLIEHEVPHSVLEGDSLVINRKTFIMLAKMTKPDPQNLFSKLEWIVFNCDDFNDDLFLYLLNLSCQMNIHTKIGYETMETLQKKFENFSKNS